MLTHLTSHLHVSEWKRPRSIAQVCSFPHSASTGPETISLVWNVSHYPSPRHMVAHFSTPTSQQKCNCCQVCTVSAWWFLESGVQKLLPDLRGIKGHQNGKNRRKYSEMKAKCDSPRQKIAAPVSIAGGLLQRAYLLSCVGQE